MFHHLKKSAKHFKDDVDSVATSPTQNVLGEVFSVVIKEKRKNCSYFTIRLFGVLVDFLGRGTMEKEVQYG